MSTLDWRSCLVVFYPSGKVVIGKALYNGYGRRPVYRMQNGTLLAYVMADTTEEAIERARGLVIDEGYALPQETANAA